MINKALLEHEAEIEKTKRKIQCAKSPHIKEGLQKHLKHLLNDKEEYIRYMKEAGRWKDE